MRLLPLSHLVAYVALLVALSVSSAATSPDNLLSVAGREITRAVTKLVLPAYPDDVRSTGAEGTVFVKVLISEKGEVSLANTESGPEPLRKAAEEAAKAWTFTPMGRDGKAMKVQSTIAFRFSAKDGRIFADGPGGVYSGPPGAVITIRDGKIDPSTSSSGVGLDEQAERLHPAGEPARGPGERPPQRVSGGVLQGKATRRVNPYYPDEAKARGMQGTAVVEVLVSETGEVISARCISGELVLCTASEEAARQWKFDPIVLEGTPVKVLGRISFNFKGPR